MNQIQMLGGKMDSNMTMFIIAAVTVVIVVGLWQGLSVVKTGVNSGQNEEYQKLAEQIMENNQKLTEAQEKNNEILEDVRTRLTAIEKLLREVQ